MLRSRLSLAGWLGANLFLWVVPLPLYAGDSAWMDLSARANLDAWKPPTGEWLVASEVKIDPENPKHLKAEPYRAGESGPPVLVNGRTGKIANLISKQAFGDIELHLEFLIPDKSNSGVKLMGLYEIQIYDSYGVERPTGSDCGGIYPRAELKPSYHHIDDGIAPRVNAARPPGEWQTLEAIFQAPRFDAQGKKIASARFLRVSLNGQWIHDNVEVRTPTGHAWHDRETATGPLLLQADHGPVAFRNVRVRRHATGLAAIPDRMQEFVSNHEIAGAVTLVATRDKVIHLEAVGQADIAGNSPMRPDTIFWIASMTKPVTATAVLMLEDEEKLAVDDPVGKYLPQLADLRTADGEPARLTLRHLLTHTSGLGEATDDEGRAARTLADLIPVYAKKPLQFEPGSKWQYCQSGINSLARIVEVVSGQSFPDFLQARLFGPLGMKDTTFYLTSEQLPRLAKSYKRVGDKLEEADIFLLYGHDPTSRDRYPAANGGLFSTAPDYGRFCQMILNQGTLDGTEYLRAESVGRMTSVQTDDLRTGFAPGHGWGLGWCVVRDPQGVTAMLSPGSHGHGGAYGTQAWIDPVKQVIYLLMVQRANFSNSDASEVRRVFQETAASSFGR